MGVDSTSHLYKVIFMVKSFREHGYVPFWTPDWYGGTPLLLLYPPLTYYICFILSLGGLDPVSSYKVVEAIFYLMAPYSIYILGKELGLTETEGWIAALLLSYSPAIIDNMLFYDRLPTVLSIPLLCLYLAYFHRSYRDKFRIRPWIGSTVFLALLILVHHLSALIAVLISIIAIASSLFDFRRIIRGSGSLISSCAASLGISSLWLMPFLDASKFVSDNPFYNRNVLDLSWGKLSFLVMESLVNFGPLHFILAMIMLGLLICKLFKRGKYFFLGFVSIFFSGLALFELGLNLSVPILKMASQSIVALLFIIMMAVSIILTRKVKNRSYGFLSLWFLVFLWFGLGGFMVPFVSENSPPFMKFPVIPYIWSKLDVHRFWLYLSIPGSILAAPPLSKTLRKAKLNRRCRWMASSLLLVLAAGGFVKAAWTLTHPINEYLPRDYTIANQDIPEGIIRYLSSDPWNGRILAVHCPFWIYLLPLHVDGKMLVDGWYPQGKILKPLYDINDYRLDDLEAASNDSERISYWRNLINDSEILGINWILIGGSNETLKSLLISGSGFREVYSEPYGEGSITIYRSVVRHSLVSWEPYLPGEITYIRIAPDRIRLEFSGDFESLNVTVREAYFPTWNARSDGSEIEVSRDDLNFISLHLNRSSYGLKGEGGIEMYHVYDWRLPISLSLVSLTFLLALSIYAIVVKKRDE
jgi:hypothetical protein